MRWWPDQASANVERARTRRALNSAGLHHFVAGTLHPTENVDIPMSDCPPDLLNSFDPALLHSELGFLQDALASPSYSEELEALQQCIAEVAAEKKRDGIVIQHRAWRTADVFRSEGEAPLGTTSI